MARHDAVGGGSPQQHFESVQVEQTEKHEAGLIVLAYKLAAWSPAQHAGNMRIINAMKERTP